MDDYTLTDFIFNKFNIEYDTNTLLSEFKLFYLSKYADSNNKIKKPIKLNEPIPSGYYITLNNSNGQYLIRIKNKNESEPKKIEFKKNINLVNSMNNLKL